MDFTKLMRFPNATQAYESYVGMTYAEGNKPMGFFDQFIPWWEGLKGLHRGASQESAESGRRYTPVKDALVASVAIVNNDNTKGDAKMATTTTRKKASTKRTGPLKSPFLLTDADEAYAAYKQMPHTKSPNARVMTKREFMKAYPQRHEAALKKESAKNAQVRQAEATTSGGMSITDVLGDGWQDADQGVIDALVNAGYELPDTNGDESTTDAPDPSVIAALAHNPEALNAYLGAFQGGTTSTAQRSNAKRYRTRTDRAELPGGGNAYDEDADEAPASNAVLWALHTEGLLRQALDNAVEDGDVLGTDNAGDEPYITQAKGKALLASVFGPLPERATA